MPIRRLRGRREALTINSEMYKKNIIQYLEARGYFVIASSDVESIFPDIIFQHQFESIENWLEVKATSVSLEDSDFIKQLSIYLREYLKRTPQNRFKFWLAAYKLISDSFEKVFENFDEYKIRELIQKIISISDENIINIIQKADYSEIKQFFETSQIIEGEPEDITKSKSKISPEPPEIPQFDDVLYASKIMNNYDDIEPAIQEHIGYTNLFPFLLPSHLFISTTPFSNPQDIFNLNPQVRFPPFRLENKVIYTFEDIEHSIFRQYVNIHTIKKDKLEVWIDKDKKNQNILMYILNKWIDNACKESGMLYDKRTVTYYYPKPKGRIRYLSKTWITPKGIKKPRIVTNPYKRNTIVNFWAHRSVQVKATKKWGNFYLRIRPRWLFSEDGCSILEGEKSDKLDRFFRKSIYNRNKNKLYDALFWYHLLFKHTLGKAPKKLKTFLSTYKKAEIQVLDCIKLKLYRKPNTEIDEIEDAEYLEIEIKLDEFM